MGFSIRRFHHSDASLRRFRLHKITETAKTHRIGNRFLGQIALLAGQMLYKSEIQIQRVL